MLICILNNASYKLYLHKIRLLHSVLQSLYTPRLSPQQTFVWKSRTLPTEGTLLTRKERFWSQLTHLFFSLQCAVSQGLDVRNYFIRLLHLHASGAAAFGACLQHTACKWLSRGIFKETLMPVAQEDEFQ